MGFNRFCMQKQWQIRRGKIYQISEGKDRLSWTSCGNFTKAEGEIGASLSPRNTTLNLHCMWLWLSQKCYFNICQFISRVIPSDRRLRRFLSWVGKSWIWMLCISESSLWVDLLRWVGTKSGFFSTLCCLSVDYSTTPCGHPGTSVTLQEEKKTQR